VRSKEGKSLSSHETDGPPSIPDLLSAEGDTTITLRERPLQPRPFPRSRRISMGFSPWTRCLELRLPAQGPGIKFRITEIS